MAGFLPQSVVVTAVAAANAAAASAIGCLTSAPSSAALLTEQNNNLRLMAVYDRISQYFNGATRNEPSDLIRLFYSLAKAIDCSLTLNSIPGIAHRLPPLVKQVYEERKNALLQSAVMMVLISIKNACRKGWFRTADSEELLCMVDEFCSKYCTELLSSTNVSNAFDTISIIMPRFYPGMMLCSLVVSFIAKPGYDVLMSDFHYSKKRPSDQMIALIVVKTENMETSSCIASPPQVSFLVNGKGVDKRTNVTLDHGPQFPTDISKMLKYGINVLQTIGYFDGTYLIAVAYVSKIPNYIPPALKDYVQPVATALESDSEIIEGPSRIQLSCPISFKRMKTPVKGHLCKHHQCFDYDNFLEMNSRRPNWRCPHCNQPVCILELRIDQNMVQILQKVSEDIVEVVIQADGSWNVVTDQPCNMDTDISRSRASMADLVDLTMEENDNCDLQILRQGAAFGGFGSENGNLLFENEDRKPVIDARNIIAPPFHINPPLANHNSSYQLGSNIRPTFVQPYATNGSVASVPEPNHLAVHGVQGRESLRHADRSFDAVQALPAATQTHSALRRVHSTVSPRQYQTAAAILENFNGGVGNMDIQQVIRSAAETSGIQDHPQQNSPYLQTEISLQHVAGQPSPNMLNSRPHSAHRRGSSDLDSFRGSLQSPSPFSRHALQTPPGFRTHPSIHHPTQSPAHPSLVRGAAPNMFSAGNYGNQRNQTQTPLPSQFVRTPPQTTLTNSIPSRDTARVLGTDQWRTLTNGAPSPLLRADGIPEPPTEVSWRSSGRMRGSLTGSEYAAVISHYMPPSNPASAGRTPMTAQTHSVSDQVSALIANNRMANGAAGNHQA